MKRFPFFVMTVVGALVSAAGVQVASSTPPEETAQEKAAENLEGKRASVAVTAPASIPFEPPVVHRGWGPHQQTLAQQQRWSSGWRPGQRDLMFHSTDRRLFQAIHPLHLRETQVLTARQTPPGGLAEPHGAAPRTR